MFYLVFLISGRNPQTEPITEDVVNKYILPDSLTILYCFGVLMLCVHRLIVNTKKND